MTQKQLISTERVRKIPKQFSWIDHRLVRDHFIEQCSHQALALYLFLVTVGDQQGLSYYSDKSIAGLLSMEPVTLIKSRNELVQTRLIVYRKPLYQVLSLVPMEPVRRLDNPMTIGQILQQITGGAQ